MATPADQQTIARALSDLRRGNAVVVRTSDGGACLLQAAEQMDDETCARLATRAGSQVSLILSHHRARAIGLAAKANIACVSIALTPNISPRHIGGLIGDSTHLPPVADLSVLPEKADSIADTSIILMRLARLLPAVLVAQLQARSIIKDLRLWAADQGLLVLNEVAIREFEATAARGLHEVARASLPLADAEDARIAIFRPSDGGSEHFALIIGDAMDDASTSPLVRIHSQCITGDILGSLRCDCGDQLRLAIRRMALLGGGILIYLAQEGRDIGLVNKLKAYALQDKGADTVEANHALGFEADPRQFLPAAEILRQLGITAIKLMTNNPDKLAQISACGIEVVERLPLIAANNRHNSKYLATKAKRSGHLIN